jgi:hypothetical protein
LLLLEVFQHVVEPLEPLGPSALVGLHPVVDGLERVTVEPVQALPSLVTHVNRSYFAEHPQVLGHLRLGQPELVHQVVDRTLTARQDIEDRAAARLGDGVEGVGGGCCSGHGWQRYIPISAYVKCGESAANCRWVGRRSGGFGRFAAYRAAN